jgi:hypothetical protein
MRGTFRSGDFLSIESNPIESIKEGDVVVFRTPEPGKGNDYIVHRVMSRSSQGFVTRGDNNPVVDSSEVYREQLIGKVLFIDRKGRKKRNTNGFRGRIRGGFLHLRFPLIKVLKFFLKGPYGLIKRSRIVPRLWRPGIKKVTFKTEKGPLVKFIHGNKAVAEWWPKSGRFRCKKPYDLIISVYSLKMQRLEENQFCDSSQVKFLGDILKKNNKSGEVE